MKKRTIILFAFITAICMAGCDGNTNTSYDYEDDYDNTTTTQATTEKEEYTNEKDTDDGYSLSTTKKEDDDELKSGEYYCMGKNDTCNNKTYSPTDLYCHSCDPDDNNVEGDQRKSDGKVGDNDYDGDIDNDDWEDEWNAFLDDKYDEYGY